MSNATLTRCRSISDVGRDEEEALGLRHHHDEHRHRDQPREQEAHDVEADVQLQRRVQPHPHLEGGRSLRASLKRFETEIVPLLLPV